MPQVVKIGCPRCGAVLSVKHVDGIESKHVTCPICKNKDLFSNFRRIEENPGEGNTQLPEQFTKPIDGTLTIGELIIQGKRYPLHIGRNIIGRQATGNTADVQIPADIATKRMSRQHAVIDVKQLQSGYYQHQLSLYKEQVNPTYLGIDRLNYGDTFILLNGNIIKLPDCELQFVVEAPDAIRYDGPNIQYK